MGIVTYAVSLVWRALEALLAIPQNLRGRVEQDWLAWKRRAALRMVIASRWPEGFNTDAVCQMVLSAEDVELVDWLYGDRSVILTSAAHFGVAVIHLSAGDTYAVTDLTDGWGAYYGLVSLVRPPDAKNPPVPGISTCT